MAEHTTAAVRAASLVRREYRELNQCLAAQTALWAQRATPPPAGHSSLSSLHPSLDLSLHPSVSKLGSCYSTRYSQQQCENGKESEQPTGVAAAIGMRLQKLRKALDLPRYDGGEEESEA
ncbi:MAG: hypothetical protein SGPRY_014618, partial [Prymnesium sp.]